MAPWLKATRTNALQPDTVKVVAWQCSQHSRSIQVFLVPRLGGYVPKSYLSMEHQAAAHKRYTYRRACTLVCCVQCHRRNANPWQQLGVRAGRLGAWPREAGEPCFVNPFTCDDASPVERRACYLQVHGPRCSSHAGTTSRRGRGT